MRSRGVQGVYIGLVSKVFMPRGFNNVARDDRDMLLIFSVLSEGGLVLLFDDS